MTEQIDGENYVQEICTLKNEICTLKHEICTLKNELNETHAQNTILINKLIRYEQLEHMHPITFDEKDFLRSLKVSYLSMCILDEKAIGTLLDMWEKLDFSCAKYLIDCWDNRGLYCWDRMFTNKNTYNHQALIHYVCARGCEQTIMYILNIYVEKNLNLRIENGYGYTPLHILCSRDFPKIIHYVLDIYVERNWDLECITKIMGYSVLMMLPKCSSVQLIERMVNIYVERNYNLERTSLSDGLNCLHIFCKYGKMPSIKFIIDVFVKYNLHLKGNTCLTLENMIQTNIRLDNKNAICLCMYLNSIYANTFVL